MKVLAIGCNLRTVVENFNFFFFGYAGSSLRCAGCSLQCMGFSLVVVHGAVGGFSYPRHVESVFPTRD